MFKKFFAFLAAMSLMAAFAAVDINKGSEAELQSIKGEFKNWEDFIARVKGFGEASATKLSAEGLTVGGAGYKPAAKDAKPAMAAKPDAKADMKADTKPAAAAAPKAADAKPAAAAAPKADAKPAAAPAAAPAAKADAKPEAPKK